MDLRLGLEIQGVGAIGEPRRSARTYFWHWRLANVEDVVGVSRRPGLKTPPGAELLGRNFPDQVVHFIRIVRWQIPRRQPSRGYVHPIATMEDDLIERAKRGEAEAI